MNIREHYIEEEVRPKHKFLLAAGLLLGGGLSAFSAHATLVVDDAFRFIRTDSYAQAGGTSVVDNGSYTIAGSTQPLGGYAAEGLFQSTIENTASATSGANSAVGRALVEVDSLFTTTANSLVFDVTAHLETEADIAGDGQVEGTPFSNGTRTFSFINHFVYFTIDSPYLYEMAGVPSPFALRHVDTSTYVSDPNGILAPGSYQFRALTQSIEYRSNLPEGNRFEELDYDIAFSVSQYVPSASVAVPAPLPLLLGAGLLLGARRVGQFAL